MKQTSRTQNITNRKYSLKKKWQLPAIRQVFEFTEKVLHHESFA